MEADKDHDAGDEGGAGGGGGGETQSQVRQPTHTGPSPTDFLRVLELITCCRTQMITIDVGRTATSHVADVMASMSLDGGGGGGDGRADGGGGIRREKNIRNYDVFFVFSY